MSEERRYKEEEIREIFGAAARDRGPVQPAISSDLGLTLENLQEIGREVGLSPERIAEAAAALERRPEVEPRRTYLGMPFSVGMSVELPRAPTDQEWARLVAELRRTFAARGYVESDGDLREWRNGNLHAYIEPTQTSYRLRLGTRKSSSLGLASLGFAGLMYGLVMFPFLLTRFGAGGPLALPIMLVFGGGAAIASATLGLPRWANLREKQMTYIAEKAQLLLGGKPLRE